MFTVVVLSVAVTVLAVCFHVAALRYLSLALERLPWRAPIRLALVLIGAIAAHFTEIGFYAIAYALLTMAGGFGTIGDGRMPGSLNFFFVSSMVFTSLGFNDNAPTGDLRVMAAFEALTGLVLITWTATLGSGAFQSSLKPDRKDG